MVRFSFWDAGIFSKSLIISLVLASLLYLECIKSEEVVEGDLWEAPSNIMFLNPSVTSGTLDSIDQVLPTLNQTDLRRELSSERTDSADKLHRLFLELVDSTNTCWEFTNNWAQYCG